jgi:hypothetical protein
MSAFLLLLTNDALPLAAADIQRLDDIVKIADRADEHHQVNEVADRRDDPRRGQRGQYNGIDRPSQERCLAGEPLG